LEQLAELAYHEKVEVLYRPLGNYSKGKLIGMYVWDPVAPCILLDESLVNNGRLHTCILAEEMGHHFSGIRENFTTVETSLERITVSKDETRAMRWATDFLIPDDELTRAVSELNLRSCWELAEYFEVTQPFIWKKLGFLRMRSRKTGIEVHSKDIFIVEMVPYGLAM
jgi:Zn-dependent peptidase ImmA (M78 family)